MYSIHNISDDIDIISDTCILIYLNQNGCYNAANSNHSAQGFCALVPTVIEQENPETNKIETIKTFTNKVFVFEGQTMKGNESVGNYTEIPAVPTITELEADLEQAYELLYGGNAT